MKACQRVRWVGLGCSDVGTGIPVFLWTKSFFFTDGNCCTRTSP